MKSETQNESNYPQFTKLSLHALRQPDKRNHQIVALVTLYQNGIVRISIYSYYELLYR